MMLYRLADSMGVLNHSFQNYYCLSGLTFFFLVGCTFSGNKSCWGRGEEDMSILLLTEEYWDILAILYFNGTFTVLSPSMF